jgi:hypothetical protein
VASSPTTSGSVCTPDAVAETPLTYWRYVGEERQRAQHRESNDEGQDHADAEHGGTKQPHGQNRVSCPGLDDDEDSECHDRTREQPKDRRRRPGVLRATPRTTRG